MSPGCFHSEFRDGNVPVGYEQKRLLEASLARLPEGIETVYLRSDSAGYQQELLEYCAEGKNERFGVIEFAIAARVSSAFKAAILEVKEAYWQYALKNPTLKQIIMLLWFLTYFNKTVGESAWPTPHRKCHRIKLKCVVFHRLHCNDNIMKRGRHRV